MSHFILETGKVKWNVSWNPKEQRLSSKGNSNPAKWCVKHGLIILKIPHYLSSFSSPKSVNEWLESEFSVLLSRGWPIEETTFLIQGRKNDHLKYVFLLKESWPGHAGFIMGKMMALSFRGTHGISGEKPTENKGNSQR